MSVSLSAGVTPLQLRWRYWIAGSGRLQRGARQLLYTGSSVHCVCCGHQARRFLATYNRRDALCPSCFSEERHRALRVFLEGWLPTLPKPLRVLHQAAEPSIGAWLREQPDVEYVTGDFGERAADLRYDLQRIPLRDGSIDVVIASHVLEHIPDDLAALAEIRRVLKPGGSAVLLVPIDSTRTETYEDPTVTTAAQREVAYWQFDHVRLYGRSFADRVASAGFSVTLRQPSRELPADDARRNGLLVDPKVLPHIPVSPPDEIYVATRPA